MGKCTPGIHQVMTIHTQQNKPQQNTVYVLRDILYKLFPFSITSASHRPQTWSHQSANIIRLQGHDQELFKFLCISFQKPNPPAICVQIGELISCEFHCRQYMCLPYMFLLQETISKTVFFLWIAKLYLSDKLVMCDLLWISLIEYHVHHMWISLIELYVHHILSPSKKLFQQTILMKS